MTALCRAAPCLIVCQADGLWAGRTSSDNALCSLETSSKGTNFTPAGASYHKTGQCHVKARNLIQQYKYSPGRGSRP